MLIGIVGLERTGKDTVANYLVKNHNFLKYNLAQPIKEIGKIMFNWDINEMETNKKDEIDTNTGIIPRDFYKWFGTQICQFEIYKHFPELKDKIPERHMWSHIMKNFVLEKRNKNINANIIIPDIRFLHEMSVLKELGGHLIYLDRIQNPNFNNYELKEIMKKENNYIDYTLENRDSIELLYKSIEHLIKIVKIKK